MYVCNVHPLSYAATLYLYYNNVATEDAAKNLIYETSIAAEVGRIIRVYKAQAVVDVDVNRGNRKDSAGAAKQINIECRLDVEGIPEVNFSGTELQVINLFATYTNCDSAFNVEG